MSTARGGRQGAGGDDGGQGRGEAEEAGAGRHDDRSHGGVARSRRSNAKLVAVTGSARVAVGRIPPFSLIFKGAGDERWFRF
ncbi:hypothetical protein CA606_13665 [Caulobacter vibrioides]|uniref:Uncharacterized protein n=1 Tax=Caulobacter vibrioides TaxID=155892 RepID=A0A290MTW6_CAUVI|nr:hypothetical protein CA606_13665 [Caulobacter vibrioides]